MSKTNRVKLVAVILFVAGVVAVLLTNNVINRRVHARSSGPDAGFSNAPGELNCAECHLIENPGSGRITIDAPSSYVPGQTYQITVRHANTDQTRLRWGFQLTALDVDGQKAGTLAPLDATTQVLDNQGPFPTRQYIEHTSNGTYPGQQFAAAWTFKWTAPAIDVGPITFYTAGNQANNDGNTSGDNIYYTFATIAPAPTAPDFVISVAPATQATTPGNTAVYNVTVTPSAGFTGQVSLSASGLPSNVNASFNPASVNITDASSKTSTLTITTNAATPLGSFNLTISGTGGSLSRAGQATLRVVSPSSVDLLTTIADSPDPVAVNTNLNYRVTVVNQGPATASNVALADTLPTSATFISASPSQGSCARTANLNCSLGSIAPGGSATVSIVVRPTVTGSISNSATVSASETDNDTSNNAAAANTAVEPQSNAPSMLIPGLAVRTVVTGLTTPASLAFLGANDFLVVEKDTGRVQRVVNGVVQSTVLDLAVNNASERGLLGIALHPDFAASEVGNKFVYLYWTWRGAGDGASGLLGSDASDASAVPLLGNRIDRFIWNGTSLTFDRNIIMLRAFQNDGGVRFGNHNGGVLRFGPDKKLYAIVGDVGRRGFLQNVTSGGPVPDDQFGGPEPDDAHMTGVILRLNDDGTTPADNPFFNAASGLSGEAAENVKKLFAYGIRNSFGMDFDPVTGTLWTQENGDDSFDEINRIDAGFNGGWIQFMGPASRIGEYKSIELPNGLQQGRWPPSLIADTPEQGLARLYMLPGARYTDPEFSWKYALAPSPIGFLRGSALGSELDGSLFVGASRPTLLGGYLFRFRFNNDRMHLAFDDPRLADRVADNPDKFNLTESESLVAGRDFGVTTDIRTGPTGNLFVVSLSRGAVYEIYAPATFSLAASAATVNENAGSFIVQVTRTGDASGTMTVDYATTNGTADERGDYTTTRGTLTFAPGERSQSIRILITDDAHVEGSENFTLSLSNATGGSSLTAPSSITVTINDNDVAPSPVNPVDDAEFFVRQHYADFFNREPDAAGLAFWTNQITSCGGNQTCIRDRRINVSAAFFISIEFQNTGYLVHRFHVASFGDNAPANNTNLPRFNSFMSDLRRVGQGVVVGQTGWETVLESNKQAYAQEWVQRPAFAAAFPGGMTAAQIVDRLFANSGVTPATAERDAAIAAFGSNSPDSVAGRAAALRRVADSVSVYNRQYNAAFVLMQYFGYLRRNPNDAPDTNFDGYNFWLNKLNQFSQAGENVLDETVALGRVRRAQMVESFIISLEYRRRFGQ